MKGITILKLKSFKDKRGEFVQLYQEAEWPRFVEEDISVSRKNVLRGLHGDHRTWKFVTCLQGEVFFAVVNPLTEEHKEVILSEGNRFAVVIPPTLAIGYLILTERAMVFYKQSTKYGEVKQMTIAWDDPKFGIPWPVKNPILSERDKNA